MTKAGNMPSVEKLTAELWGCLDAEQAARKAIEYMTPWLRAIPQDMPSVDELVERLYPVIEENSDGFMRDGLSPSWHAWVKLLVESTVAELQPWLNTKEDHMALMPEIKIEQLQPIDFGPNDEDRVKDMFEKVFMAEYEHVRKGSGATTARGMADIAATEAATTYRAWLKAQEPK